MAQFDEHGHQVPDPRPVEWPAGLKRPPTLQEEMRRFIRGELSRAAQESGEESFEEADDFDVNEDPDMLLPTAYELAPEQVDRDASDLTKPEDPLPAKPGEATVNAPAGGGASAPAPPANPPPEAPGGAAHSAT